MNTSKRRIVITEESIGHEAGNALSLLRNMGFHITQIPHDGTAVCAAMQQVQPDVVVMDATMPHLDAIAVMERAMDPKPIFIVTSIHESECLERQVMESGASYFMRKPISASVLTKRIETLLKLQEENEKKTSVPAAHSKDTACELEIAVTQLIHQLGVPAHIRGYQYLRTAIVNAVLDPTLLESVTKSLYPFVAKRHTTTASRVERAIRHAIGLAWDRGNLALIEEVFGYTIDYRKGRPTNSEFIAMLTDRMILQGKKELRRV